MRKLSSVALAGLVAGTVLTACDPEGAALGPDLVPERISDAGGRTALCRLADGGLMVRLRNQSNLDALATTRTQVTFGATAQSLASPPIAGGSFADVGPFAIPAGCFSSDCSFSVQVDADDAVAEGPGASAETNNVAAGLCIG